MAKKPSADDTTLQLIQEVKRRKEEIADSERSNYKTNLSFAYVEWSSSAVNLQVQKVDTLLKIAAFLRSTEAAYENVAKEMGVDDYPSFKWGGFTVEEWVADIKLKISKLQVEAKRKKLEVLEARLNSIVSPELRQQMELEAIQKELG